MTVWRFRIATTLLLAAALLVSSLAALADAPRLAQTQLYATIARDCRPADIATSSPSAAKTLQASHAKLAKMEFCNSGQYTIFTVEFRFDPRTATGNYFHLLYAQMAAANKFRSYSFVDTEDNVIIDVAIDGKHQLDITYEDFTPGSD